MPDIKEQSSQADRSQILRTDKQKQTTTDPGKVHEFALNFRNYIKGNGKMPDPDDYR